MQERDRVKLLGRYRTPRFRYGDVVTCEVRGDMKIVGLSNARGPWPKGRTGKRSRASILYGARAEAVRRESAVAVAYWFGVGKFTVWHWRKALGVDPSTPGTAALRSRWAPETCQSDDANAKRDPTLHSADRAAKIAASRRGKPRPQHVIEAMRRVNVGKKASKATRKKMSAAHKKRGTRPPAAGGEGAAAHCTAMRTPRRALEIWWQKGKLISLLQTAAAVPASFTVPPPHPAPARDRLAATDAASHCRLRARWQRRDRRRAAEAGVGRGVGTARSRHRCAGACYRPCAA